MSGLFTTVMSCFLRTRVRGSVTPVRCFILAAAPLSFHGFSLSLDSPAFNKARCKVNNTTVLLGWLAPETKCCVDYYVLEVDMVKSSEFATRRKKDRKFKRLYEGAAREYALYSVPYSVNIIARVFGANPTGEGTPSEELILSTPTGRC